MNLDIILYAIVAAILLLRLWSLLGRRNDDEVERSNPFAAPKSSEPNKTDALALPDTRALEALPLLRPPLVAPTSLAGGLESIRILDATFDEKKFLQGARQAFAMIIENFAGDNLAPIQHLLGPDVLPHFQAAVAARQAAGQKMSSKVTRIIDAETIAASVSGKRAIVGVRFVSEQENVLRDAGGHIIGGDVGKIEHVTDIWTFARNTDATDPNWILVETRV